MFQFNIVFGILVAFASIAALGNIGENAWRWMLGIEAIPALIYSLMCFSLPESPRWLIGRKGDLASGRTVLQKIYPNLSAERISELVEEISKYRIEPGSKQSFWNRQKANSPGVSDRIFQSAFRHQCDSILCTANF